MAAYRQVVTTAASGAGEHDFEIRRMQLELADHDGGVDAAIALLSDRQRTAWGGIVQRLRAAGRDREAMTWTDRAVHAGRVSSRGPGNEYWSDPDDVAAAYVDDGRDEDAIAVLRQAFRDQPGAARAGRLLALTSEVGRGDLTAGADSRRYRGIANRLRVIRTLHERAGTEDEFAQDLRERSGPSTAAARR